MIDRYITFKIFELFRDRLKVIIDKYRDVEVNDVYKHIFIAPAQYARVQSFKLRGISSPYIAVWPTSPVEFNKQMYGRSVIQRWVECLDNGKKVCKPGHIYDLEKSYELTASSYFKEFVGEVNFGLIQLDRIRFFELNLNEYIEGLNKCMVELALDGLAQTDSVDEAVGNREFILSAKYRLRITLPVLFDTEYIQKVAMWMNGRCEYEANLE